MATTSSNPVVGKAISGQGSNGNNGWFGLKAKLAGGVAILGCAAALAFGQLRPAQTAQPLPASNPYWTYQEDVILNGNPALVAMPATSLTGGTVPYNAEDFTYGEDRYGTIAAPIVPAQFGPQEFLPGEEPASGGGTPSPTFGPQP